MRNNILLFQNHCNNSLSYITIGYCSTWNYCSQILQDVLILELILHYLSSINTLTCQLPETVWLKRKRRTCLSYEQWTRVNNRVTKQPSVLCKVLSNYECQLNIYMILKRFNCFPLILMIMMKWLQIKLWAQIL